VKSAIYTSAIATRDSGAAANAGQESDDGPRSASAEDAGPRPTLLDFFKLRFGPAIT